MTPQQFSFICDQIWNNHVSDMETFFQDEENLKLYYDKYQEEKNKFGVGSLVGAITLKNMIIGKNDFELGWYEKIKLCKFCGEDYNDLILDKENMAYIMLIFSMTGPKEMFNGDFVYPSGIVKSCLITIIKTDENYKLVRPEKCFINITSYKPEAIIPNK